MFSSAPLLFPLLMFVASLAVAYYAVDRLVVRHVKNLRNKVQAFSRTRRLPSASDQFSLSAELQDLEDALEWTRELQRAAMQLGAERAKARVRARETNPRPGLGTGMNTP